MTQQPAPTSNPFLALAARSQAGSSPVELPPVKLPMVALKGKRNGYIMLATAQEITTYADLPIEILIAAKDWTATLEQAGSPRAYWSIWSEVTRHLHIHLFPRWPEDTLRGTALFETRDSAPQPAWTPELLSLLESWAERHQVAIG